MLHLKCIKAGQLQIGSLKVCRPATCLKLFQPIYDELALYGILHKPNSLVRKPLSFRV
jgi:hypothetical protein